MGEPEKIGSCPFCGRTQHTGLAFTRRTRGRDDFPTHRVECACGACGSSYPSQREAISAWNRVARSVALLGEAEEALAHTVAAAHPTALDCDRCADVGRVLAKIRKENVRGDWSDRQAVLSKIRKEKGGA